MGYLPIIIWDDATENTLKTLNYLQNRVHICLDKIDCVSSTKENYNVISRILLNLLSIQIMHFFY